MDAAQALADLAEVSSQIEGAVLARGDGSVVASTFSDEAKGGRVAEGAGELLRAVEATVKSERAAITQLVAETTEGAVFVAGDGELLVAAVTVPEPTVGLVFYDLRTCLRLVAEAEETPKPRSRRKTGAGAKAGEGA
jgi:predicted regulator of Ras-like GTPase activity (Roadblock/LC7/MglB family)